MYCCSMHPMRYSAVADRDRPASTWELTSVDLVIHVAMAAAVGYMQSTFALLPVVRSCYV